MARNMEFSYSRNQYFVWVIGCFLNLVNFLKLRDSIDSLYPLKRNQKVWLLSSLAIRAGGEWCLPQIENACSTSPQSLPHCSPPRPVVLLLSMLSAGLDSKLYSSPAWTT